MIGIEFLRTQEGALHFRGDIRIVGTGPHRTHSRNRDFIDHAADVLDAEDNLLYVGFDRVGRRFTGEQYVAVVTCDVDVHLIVIFAVDPAAGLELDIRVLDLDAGSTPIFRDHGACRRAAHYHYRRAGGERAQQKQRRRDSAVGLSHGFSCHSTPSNRQSMPSQRQCSASKWTS